jgi:hypothetical protein
MSKLNSKTLTIGAIVLLVLALLFMATPLLRVTGITGGNRTGFNRQFNGGTNPGGQNGFQGFGNGTQGQGNPNTPGTPNNSTGRTFSRGARSLFGFGLLSGITGTIVYGIALLVSLLAAIGMFLTKRWGQVLGIIMGVLYLLLAIVGLIPTILIAFTFARGFSALSLGLTILHLVLAIAVIVLAFIPAKKMMTPAAPAVAESTPPAAGA